MKRELRARATSTLSIAPATVTDLNAPMVLGLEPRCFREFLAREKVAHARIGHRVVARLEHVLAAFDRIASDSTDSAAPEASAQGEEEPNADAILARIGRVRGGR